MFQREEVPPNDLFFSARLLCRNTEPVTRAFPHGKEATKPPRTRDHQDIPPFLTSSATVTKPTLRSGSQNQAASSTALITPSLFTLYLRLSSSSPRVSGPCGTHPLPPLSPWSLQSSACGRPPSARPWSYLSLHQPDGSGHLSEFHSVCLQLSERHARPSPEYRTVDLQEQAPERLLHLLPTEGNADSFPPTHISMESLP